MLQLTINLLPVNHEPFFQLSYYVVRDFSESALVGTEVIRGKYLLVLSGFYTNFFIGIAYSFVYYFVKENAVIVSVAVFIDL